MSEVKSVIGLDIGNIFCFASVLFDGDPQVHDLQDRMHQYGYPTVFAYTRSGGELVGNAAMRNRVSAKSVRMLKRLLQNNNQSFTLDGKTFRASEALQKVIAYVINNANRIMQQNYMRTTNHVRVAFPETFDPSLVIRYKQLIEEIVLENGEKVIVDGMICEPAAAALDYLNRKQVTTEENVLCYDLGGGTCDICVVTAYPQGKVARDGRTYYSNMQRRQTGMDIGGQDLTLRLADLIRSRLQAGGDKDASPERRQSVLSNAENMKLRLSSDENTDDAAVQEEIDLTVDNSFLPADLISVSRQQFYDAKLASPDPGDPYGQDSVRDLLKRTVAHTRTLYDAENPDHPISTILLVGGSSNLPLVSQLMEAEFSDELAKGLKIAIYDPSRAISHGVARFAHSIAPENTMLQSMRFSLGEKVIRGENGSDEIFTMIGANASLPADSGYVSFLTRHETKIVDCTIYSARNDAPDPKDIEGSYTKILNYRFDFQRTVPRHTKLEIRLVAVENGDVRLYVRDPATQLEEQASCRILNY